MNVFYLDRNAKICAQQHCDAHTCKMILEYGQLLSTAHRLIDGKHEVILQNGRRKQVWTLVGDTPLYAASHVNHPSAIWARENFRQYEWLYHLFCDLLREYTHRYGKIHSAERLKSVLGTGPRKIRHAEFKDPPLCMPEEYKVDDAVTSYQNFYVGSKARFAKWTNRRPPDWFISRTPNYVASHFERTRAVAA